MGTGTLVLLVTASKAESQALFEVLKEVGLEHRTYLHKGKYVATDLGCIKRIRIIHVQCEPGSVGPSSSQAVITDAIRDFLPSAVIVGGMAFGANPSKQGIGDVLISKTIVEYERAKFRGEERIPRGQRIESSPKLISLFRVAESEGLHPRVHVGTLLSGEKLVDSEAFLRELLAQEPEAIGGEMEGAGLVAAAQRAGTDWIVVKAIVDWAHDKQSQNNAEHQRNVAKVAFRFIVR